jgi:hypothetical protein
LIHSHCHDDVNSFVFQFLIFLRIFLVARYRACYLCTHIDPELVKDILLEEPTESSLHIKATNLGFTKDISDKDLADLLVEKDEFYQQEIIEFVE